MINGERKRTSSPPGIESCRHSLAPQLNISLTRIQGWEMYPKFSTEDENQFWIE